MRFFSIFLAIVFMFAYMQVTSCGLIGVDADVLSKTGSQSGGSSSKGELIDVDLDILSSP
nr:unnamed protein product [Callosobruchus analis]